MYNKYYQDELSFLRELGREFSRTYPEAAPFLAEAGNDPDVERLLEGFSFLTARIRQKLDDEIPEFTHALLEMFWPHYLRPIPSMAVVQFDPLPQATKEAHKIARGVELDSVPVDGTPCRFRTAYDVWLAPVTFQGVELRTETPPSLRLRFRFSEGVGPKRIGVGKIRLHLHGEPVVTRALYATLCRFVKRVVIRGGEGSGQGKQVVLGPEAVTPAGLSADEYLLPYPATSFQGFRLLQEYFAFPSKFMFVDIAVDRIAELGEVKSFDVLFELHRLPEGMPAITPANFLLNCVPAVNLFRHEGDPVRVDRERTEYKVRPSGTNSLHYEIYTIDKVVGHIKGTAKPRIYHPFFSFAHSLTPNAEEASFYRARTERSVRDEGTDLYVSFQGMENAEALQDVETISLELTCTNRLLPTKLRVGDVCVPTSTSPPIAKFKNITRPVQTIPPPLGGGIYWRLLSHLALNYMSLSTVEAFRGILQLYHFRAMTDRQAEQSLKLVLQGIKSVQAVPASRMFQGTPVRGISITLELDEDSFAGEGDMYLFSVLLNEFLSLYVTLNSFSQLTVKGVKFGEIHQWPPRIGTRIIL